MKKILLTLVVAFITFFQCKTFNIKQLKGTHTIVPADYSPVMGMALSEWRVLRQWYELSPKHLKSEMTEVLQNNPKADLFQKQSIEELQTSLMDNAVENLLHSMFHIATGNFNVTHAMDNPVMQLKAEHIGKILRVVHDWTAALSDPKKLEELKEMIKQEPKQVPELLSELSRMSPAVRQIKKQTTLTQTDQQFLNDFETKHKKMVRLRSKHASALRSKKESDTVFVSYNLKYELMSLVEDFGFENSQKKLFKPAHWNTFVNSLVDGLKLQQIGPDQVYAQNTVQEILLGYMLATSHNRSDLENYFRAFLRDDNFVLTHEMYTDQEIKERLASQVNAKDFEPFADLMCAFTYQEKYASKFPKIVEGNDKVEYQGVGFADCMETAMRNLVNIITYLEGKLGIVPEGLTMSPQLQKFYQTAINSDNASVGHKDVHQNWTDVIENIEGASYDYLVYQGHKVASHCDGFIFVDNFNDLDKTLPKKSVELNGKTIELIEKKVDGRTYLLVAKNPDLFGCELMPNISNMVVVLNNLFNLQLYPSSKSVIEPDFASKYLQLVCEKLGWTLQSSSKFDGLHAELNITCKQGDFKMKLSNKIHGSLWIAPKDQLKINLVIPRDTQQSRIAVAMSDQLIEKYESIPARLDNPCLIHNLDVFSNDARLKVAKDMLQNWTTLSSSEKNYIQKMIVSFGLHADSYYLASVINSVPSTFEYKDLLFNAMIMFSIKNRDQSLSLVDLMIHRNLLSTNKVNTVLQFLEKGITEPSHNVRAAFMRSINSLITNRLMSTDQAIPFLEKGLNDSDYNIRDETMSTINYLITNRLMSTDQALPLLEKGINDSGYHNIQLATMKSINYLITNKLMTVDQAIPFLEKSLKSFETINENVRALAMRLLKTLITENLINSDNIKQLSLKNYYKRFDWDTLQILVNKNLINFDTAYSLALQTKVDKARSTYENFSKHMNEIFNIDQIAQKGIDSTNDADLMKTVEQLSDMLYLGFEITSKDISKILQVTEKGLNSTKKTIASRATRMFQSLIGGNNKTKINPDEIQTITQKLLELKDIGALTQMCYLNLISTNKSDQLISIIKEKLNSSDSEKEIDLDNSDSEKIIDLDNSDSEKAIDLIESMIPKKLITTDQIKELITAAPKYKTDLEKLLIKAQALEPKMTGEGMLSRGAFKTTPVASMRHYPYATDIVSKELAARGMSAQDVGEEFEQQYAKDRARLMHMQQQDELGNEYQRSNYQQERQKFEERQTMMPEKPWDDATRPTDIGTDMDRARLSIVQQRRLMQQAIARNRLKLPTAAELGRGAARGARGAIL